MIGRANIVSVRESLSCWCFGRETVSEGGSTAMSRFGYFFLLLKVGIDDFILKFQFFLKFSPSVEFHLKLIEILLNSL